MNLFLGVKIPSEVAAEVSSQTLQLHMQYQSFAWYPPDSMRIPIYSVGEVPESKMKDIASHLEELFFDVPLLPLYSLGLNILTDKGTVLYVEFQRNTSMEKIHMLMREFCDPERKKMQHPFKLRLTFAKGQVNAKQQYSHLRNRLYKTEFHCAIETPEVWLFSSETTGAYPSQKQLMRVR